MNTNKIKIAIVCAALLSCLISFAAEADARLCNESSKSLVFSVKYTYGNAENKAWKTVGWIKLEPDECSIWFWEGDATNKPFYFNIWQRDNYGQAQVMAIEGSSYHNSCIKAESPYTIYGEPSTCPTNSRMSAFYKFVGDEYDVEFSVN